MSSRQSPLHLLLCSTHFYSSAPSPAREARRQQWPYGAMRASEDEHSANKLLAGQENSVAQPKTDKWFSFSLHFSLFLTVSACGGCHKVLELEHATCMLMYRELECVTCMHDVQ